MAENPFEAAQMSAFNTVGSLMGYDASWTPSNVELSPCTARVLRRSPTTKERESLDLDNSKQVYFMEYKNPDLPGLFESIENGGEETIMINSVNYFVQKIEAIYDGNSFKVRLYQN